MKPACFIATHTTRNAGHGAFARIAVTGMERQLREDHGERPGAGIV